MKGQYKIFEEILIFAIGMGIASMVLLVFNGLSSNVNQRGIQNQLKDICNLVSAEIINTYEMGNNTMTKIKIPKEINGKPYVIELIDTGSETELTTYMYGNKKLNYTKSMYSIKVDPSENKVMSSSWYIEIYVDSQNKVHLKRWEY